MFDFFDQVIGFIETVFTFFLNMVQSLIQAITFMSNGVTFSLMMVGYMPAIIGTAITIFIAIYVLKFLIGR